jgi:hypothetical protein
VTTSVTDHTPTVALSREGVEREASLSVKNKSSSTERCLCAIEVACDL